MNVDDYVLLLTSAGAQEQVIDWLDRYTIMEDLVVEDITSQDTMLSVLGPESRRHSGPSFPAHRTGWTPGLSFDTGLDIRP